MPFYMNKINDNDENTQEYWDNVYLSEFGTSKKRLDQERLQYVKGAILDWMSRNMQESSPKFVDFGCGGGELVNWLQYELPQIQKLGIDFAEQTIKRAQKTRRNISFAVGDLNEQVPLPIDSVDVAFCGETLEHLKDPNKTLDLIFSTIKEGGYLILSVPCKNNNPTSEHNFTFDTWDLIRIANQYGTLMHIDVVAGGLSLICIIRKEIKQTTDDSILPEEPLTQP